MHPFHAIRPLHIRHAGLYEVHAAGTQTKARVLVVKLTPLGVGAAAAAQQCAHRACDIGMLMLSGLTSQVGQRLFDKDFRACTNFHRETPENRQAPAPQGTGPVTGLRVRYRSERE